MSMWETPEEKEARTQLEGYMGEWREKYEKTIRRTLEERLATVGERVIKVLEEDITRVIYSTLGFKIDSWGRLEIENRDSEVVRKLGERAMKAAEAQFDSWLDQLLKGREKLSAKYAEALVESFERHVKYKMEDRLQHYADLYADEKAREIYTKSTGAPPPPPPQTKEDQEDDAK